MVTRLESVSVVESCIAPMVRVKGFDGLETMVGICSDVVLVDRADLFMFVYACVRKRM